MLDNFIRDVLDQGYFFFIILPEKSLRPVTCYGWFQRSVGVGQSLRGRPTGQLVPPAAAEISSLRSHAQRGLQSPAQEMGIGAIFF